MYQYHYQRPSAHYLFDVAQGKFYDQTAVNIFGYNREVGATYETIWNNGATYVHPSSAVTMSVVSSSASDTMSVLISGLDANYDQITDTVTLSGITPVTTTKAFLCINSAIILAGSNVGNISISNGGTTYGYIEAGVGTTQACVFTVPAGHTLYIFRIDVNSATATGSQYLTIRNRVETETGRILRVAEATLSESQVSYDRQIPFQITEKTKFEFEAKSSSSTNVCAIFVEALLIKN